MAIWHLFLGLGAALFTSLILVAALSTPSDPSTEGSGLAVLAGIVLAGGGIAAGLIFSAIAFGLLGRDFWRPNLSVILMPGFWGTLVTMPASIIGWPTSEIVGIWAAFVLVSRQLDTRSGTPVHL